MPASTTLRIWLTIFVAAACLPAAAAKPATEAGVKAAPLPLLQPTDPAYIPLGVYSAGEYVPRADKERKQIDWVKTEQDLDGMQERGCTAVWLTHLNAAQTAEFARRAARRGISVVASLGNIDGSVERFRKGNVKQVVEQTLAAWGDAPRPLAWGLGDEPKKDYMDQMKPYAAAWKKHVPQDLVTTVVMHRDMEAASKAGFDALAADIYPFFSRDNPNRFMGRSHDAWLRNVKTLVSLSPRPWMMGQAYQEPWGPFEYDKGNVVYLPGGAPHWEMPTPDMIRWQALTAIAGGAKGMFYFIYRRGMAPKPDAKPTGLPAKAKERTDSGAPMALTHMDGRPTKQYDAMGEAFRWIRRHGAVLGPAQPAAGFKVGFAGDEHGASVARVLADPKTGRKYLVVVASYHRPRGGPLTVVLDPKITALENLDTGKPQPVAAGRAAVTLAPGTAAIFACTVAGD